MPECSCSVCQRSYRMQITQLRDPTTFLLFSQRLSDVMCTIHPGGEDFHGEEKSTSHVRASTPQLRAKASRLQPGPPCPIPACVLEPLPCSSLLQCSQCRILGSCPGPSPASLFTTGVCSASQIHLLIHATEPRLCSAGHCSIDSETQHAHWLQLVSQ